MTSPHKVASRLEEEAEGDSVTAKKLKGNVTFTQYLNYNSVIDYLNENEQPHYFLHSKIEQLIYDGEKVATGMTTTRSVVVTDQRILLIVKTLNNDSVWELPYTIIESINSNKGMAKHSFEIVTLDHKYVLEFRGTLFGPFGFEYSEIRKAESYIQNLSETWSNQEGTNNTTGYNTKIKEPFTDLAPISPRQPIEGNESDPEKYPEHGQGGLGELSGKENSDDDQSFREEVKEVQKARNEDQEGQPNTQMGSSVEPSEKNTRSPRELVERAEGDIKLKHLKDTSGRVTPWLDKPVIEYLRQNEQPEFIFADLSTDLEFEFPDRTSGEIGYATGAQFLVITDQRILYVNGSGGSAGMEDEILVRDYNRIEKVGAEGGWLSDGIGFVDEDGVEFRFSITGNTDFDDAIEYLEEKIQTHHEPDPEIRENIHTHHEPDPEIQELVANAKGDTVTYQALTEHTILPVLDQDEQPHHLLEGNTLLIEGGDEVEKKGGAGGSVITVVTDKRVLCNIETGGLVNIPYDSITSIEYGLPPEDEWEINIPVLAEFSGQTEKLILHTQGRVYYIDLNERMGILPDRFVLDEYGNVSGLAYEVINYIRKQRKNVPDQSERSGSNVPETDPLDQIERLKELNEQGAITDEEFEEKKSDLLDQV